MSPLIGSSQLENIRMQLSAVETISHTSASVKEAYFAAATAAFHPNPDAQTDFLGSYDSHLRLKHAIQPLQLDAAPGLNLSSLRLSSKSLESLSIHLAYSPSHLQPVPAPLKLKKCVYSNVVLCENEFWDQQKRVKSMVEIALAKYNMRHRETFELHVICGVNELVGCRLLLNNNIKPARFNPMEPSLYHYTHVNFLAIPKGYSEDRHSNFARYRTYPVLFFAEYDNYKNNLDNDSCWCVLTGLREAEQVRCMYCEREGSRIVHPISEDFCGRSKEFEKMLLGEAPCSGSVDGCYENDMLIRGMSGDADWVHDVEDDSIYIEYCVDEDDNCDLEDRARHMRFA